MYYRYLDKYPRSAVAVVAGAEAGAATTVVRAPLKKLMMVSMWTRDLAVVVVGAMAVGEEIVLDQQVVACH